MARPTLVQICQVDCLLHNGIGAHVSMVSASRHTLHLIGTMQLAEAKG